MAKPDYSAFARDVTVKKKKRITEDDPRWNPGTMGNKTGHKGQNYWVNGKLVRRGPKAS